MYRTGLYAPSSEHLAPFTRLVDRCAPEGLAVAPERMVTGHRSAGTSLPVDRGGSTERVDGFPRTGRGVRSVGREATPPWQCLRTRTGARWPPGGRMSISGRWCAAPRAGSGRNPPVQQGVEGRVGTKTHTHESQYQTGPEVTDAYAPPCLAPPCGHELGWQPGLPCSSRFPGHLDRHGRCVHGGHIGCDCRIAPVQVGAE